MKYTSIFVLSMKLNVLIKQRKWRLAYAAADELDKALAIL